MQANGNYDMEFRLFDTPTVGSGTQIGVTQTRSSVPVASGIFTVQLGFGDADIYDTTRLYLEVSVKPAGSGAGLTTLAPRQLVTSAPTAIQARNAKTADNAANSNSLGGVAASSYLQTNGNGSGLTNLNADSITSGVLPIANGGTGSATKNFVDLISNQSVGGNKSFVNSVSAVSLSVSNNAIITPAQTTFNGVNGLLVTTSNASAGAIPMTGVGTRMMFYPRKAAFRAGEVSSDNWDDANIGEHSVAMGNNSQAKGDSSLAIGDNVYATGLGSQAIGAYVSASGTSSTALGFAASTNGHAGSFVYGDSAGNIFSPFGSNTDNEFAVRAKGGFRFRTSTDLANGCNLAPGGGSFACTSSKSLKENFLPLSGSDVLSRLRKIPVMQWNYTGEGQKIHHIGAFAEDFYREFRLGTDDKSIGLLDIAGVNTAAIKALDERTENLQRENNRLKSEIKHQQTAIDNLKRLVCTNNLTADICREK